MVITTHSDHVCEKQIQSQEVIKGIGETDSEWYIKLQDCSGRRFPKRCSRSEYRSPVIYYGKKVSKSRTQSSKENKETDTRKVLNIENN